MIVSFAGQVPKSPAFREDIEDAMSLAPLQGRIAVSDGASESFDSQSWARVLTSRFIVDSELSADWISTAVRTYTETVEPDSLSYFKRAAFDRGSFATLLGVEYQPTANVLNVFAVGDSLAALIDGRELIETFAYTRSSQFEQRPELFSTSAQQNSDFTTDRLSTAYLKKWQLDSLQSATVLCMTDALGQWALRQCELGTPPWDELIGITDERQFEALILRERDGRAMRVDDVTLVRLSFFVGGEGYALPDT